LNLKKERISQILNAFTDKQLMVVGDIMIDEYLTGKVTRLSPEAPVPIIEIKDEITRFGGAANVALNVKELGCKTILVGVVGEDRHAEIFNTLMQEHHIFSQVIVSKSRPTTVKTRIIGDNQHIARVDREQIKYLTDDELQAAKSKIQGSLETNKVDAVILEDYNKGVLSKDLIHFIVSACKEKSIPVFVDPKFENFMEYSDVTIFKPNVKEAQQALARNFNNEKDVEQAGFQLLQELNCASVLLTRGPKGLSLFEKDNVVHIATQAREVADVSGAGDTVISTLAAAYVAGASTREAAILANIAAGIVVEEIGIVPVTKEKLLSVAN
jgi:D-glycero-beta-D-manno-heptose-7-phosphate kinase